MQEKSWAWLGKENGKRSCGRGEIRTRNWGQDGEERLSSEKEAGEGDWDSEPVHRMGNECLLKVQLFNILLSPHCSICDHMPRLNYTPSRFCNKRTKVLQTAVYFPIQPRFTPRAGPFCTLEEA